MATQEPVRPILSVEDAELYASKIRPSWELIDDSMRDELAADLAPPAGATPGSDTIIVGVPTVPIGDDSPPVHESSLAAHANGGGAAAPRAGVSPTLSDEVAKPGAAAAAVSSATAPFPQPSPLRPSKTQMGIGGEGALKPVQAVTTGGAQPAPSSRRAVRAAPAAAPATPLAVPAQARPSKTQPEDDIQIPVTGASKGLLLKLGLGAAALTAVAIIGFGVMGGGKSKGTDAAPTAEVTAAAKAPPPAQTAAAPEPAATQAPAAAPSPTVAAKEPEPKAKEPEPKAKEPEPKKAKEPEPKKAAAPAPEPKKAAPAPEPKKAAAPASPPPKKGGGGIIRETPF